MTDAVAQHGRSPRPRAARRGAATDAAKRLLAALDAADDDAELDIGDQAVVVSHLSRVYWPAEPGSSQGPITKRDYLRYLIGVAPALLEHVRDRPLTLFRWPEGVARRRHLEKHWNMRLPEFVERLDVFSESATGGEYLAIRWDDAGTGSHSDHHPLRPQRTAPAVLLQQALGLRRLLLGQAPLAQVEALVQPLLAGLDAMHAPRPALQVLAGLRPLYARVLERIDDEIGHPDEDLSLAALSAQVQHTPLVFLRHFKQLTGMTPHAYVNERRLQRVRHALEDPRNALADAAALAGYASQSHMGTAMQRAFRLTPVGYRARAQAGSGAPG